jgi:hypothetical protein
MQQSVLSITHWITALRLHLSSYAQHLIHPQRNNHQSFAINMHLISTILRVRRRTSIAQFRISISLVYLFKFSAYCSC